ncbi:MAG: SDR family oxidoreductase [Candidatus Kapabacteria bacterium]|nr:SDR family oxidoreductase [Ignavibacteria bacterium]MBK6418247.1 SDR family oxidoreductase [Ignavibacteria bacterium]MBK7412384.1 SDR family oxidoreductase [Ignavibacteria bacterium]MBP6509704.1 SDR family oxidoreductase [Candidatus Kapabacteria bacterium]
MPTMLITGSSGGLGRVVANQARTTGWNVFAVNHEHGDLADENVLQRLVPDIPQDLTAVVHLVGGITAGKPLDQTTQSDLEHMLRLNVTTTFNVMQATIPLLRSNGGGSIVTIGAQAVVHPVPNRSLYAASKSAVVSLTQSVAEEGRSEGIRCNCILPSVIRTEANLAWADGAMADEWVTPEQIATTILHLCSPECGLSGGVIPMFGRGSF